MIPTIDSISAACGILVQPDSEEGFRHLATAWQIAPGEWLCVWEEEETNYAELKLIHAHSGKVADITNWEQDSGLAGFRSEATDQTLNIAGEGDNLSKRQPLVAIGYPSVINHPAFAIHRGSLNCERYHPYLCPWIIEGHLALFTKDQGWISGTGYHGMEGGPVLNDDGKVVGLLNHCGGEHVGTPPLSSFKRISS